MVLIQTFKMFCFHTRRWIESVSRLFSAHQLSSTFLIRRLAMPATYSLPSWELCDTVAWVGAYNQRDPLRFLYAVVGLSIDVKRENWSIFV